jgi:addiction module HigA family antidote
MNSNMIYPANRALRARRRRNHPGAILMSLYLEPMNFTISDFANAIGVSRKAVSAIVNGHKSITPEMALRLAKALNTTPELWLNAQHSYDLWKAEQNISEDIKNIQSLRHVFA